MTKHFCDRCGKDVTDGHDHYKLTVALGHPFDPSQRISFTNGQRDLCLSCARDIVKWMTTQAERVQAA